ncbi:MAG: AbiV family abortive infection protein, partial [Planctomycetes bacterium]|nr:AbiV family abortive infection protein [Planctomycetota bacterium]
MAREKPGYVTPVEIQKGIYYCIQNVGDILEDCNLLLENNRYTRALALSISALEEMGKISVLRSINRLPKNKQKLRSIEWNKFYEHQHKS